jgi:hypothetical protein
MNQSIFDKYSASLIQAGRETAVFMTAQLRAQCKSSGWDAATANQLKVGFDDDGFKLVIPERLKDEVFALEYGTTSTQPTAALRKFNNRLEGVASYMMTRAKKLAGGL